jgi:hypothetical protein
VPGRRLKALSAVILLLGSSPASADVVETPDIAVPGSVESSAEPPPESELTAREIYRRVLANRFESSVQELRLISGDRAGNQQLLRMRALWKRYPKETEEDGVLSRTVVRYLKPPDLRSTGYLVINKRDRPNDQFIYLKSMRRVRRINLRGSTIVGTDFSVEDLIPRELDDADYLRIADAEVGDTPCYVVEATPKPEMESEYSKFWLYVEQAHYVPLRIRYWERVGIEVKELRSPVESIREIDGVWIPIESTMRQLLEKTETSLSVDLLVPNPELPDRFFSQRQLESKRLRLPSSVMEKARRP